MHDVRCMRTTVNLGDDVLRASKDLVALSGRTLGEVLWDRTRAASCTGREESPHRNGVPLLPATADGRLVPSENGARLLDEG
jgi:hypothetical protein